MAKDRGSMKIDLGAVPDINTLFSSIIKDLSKEFPEFEKFDVPIVLSFRLRIENGVAVIEDISASSSPPQPQQDAQRRTRNKVPQGPTASSLEQINKYPKDREPLVDVSERNGVASVTAEMNGAARESIQVTANGNTLTIQASTRYGPFDRKLELSGSINPQAAVAHYTNGVLEITAPLDGKRHGKAIIKVS